MFEITAFFPSPTVCEKKTVISKQESRSYIFFTLGAMLSHDNLTWTARTSMEHYKWNREVLMSYLPMSHIAACMIDCFQAMYVASEVHFADKDALKGTLVRKFKS